jgi:hypothetical protein
LVAPGQLPASPNPNAKRKAAKLFKPTAIEVAIAAAEYHTTERLRPSRVPSRSMIRPANVCPMAYATRNAMSTIAKSVLVHSYSIFR